MDTNTLDCYKRIKVFCSSDKLKSRIAYKTNDELAECFIEELQKNPKIFDDIASATEAVFSDESETLKLVRRVFDLNRECPSSISKVSEEFGTSQVVKADKVGRIISMVIAPIYVLKQYDMAAGRWENYVDELHLLPSTLLTLSNTNIFRVSELKQLFLSHSKRTIPGVVNGRLLGRGVGKIKRTEILEKLREFENAEIIDESMLKKNIDKFGIDFIESLDCKNFEPGSRNLASIVRVSTSYIMNKYNSNCLDEISGQAKIYSYITDEKNKLERILNQKQDEFLYNNGADTKSIKASYNARLSKQLEGIKRTFNHHQQFKNADDADFKHHYNQFGE